MGDDHLDIEDAASLLAYLRRTGRIAHDESPRLTRLTGGVSNRAILVRRASGESWVLKQALPQLRVRVQWFSDPRRIEREALGMRRLGEVAPAGSITPLLFTDIERHLLAMAAVPEPHENWKNLLLAGRIEASHVEQFATLLGTVHRAAWQQRERLAGEFEDRSFFDSLRVEPYYFYSAERMPAVADFVHALVDDSRATRLTLVHGDYSPKNVLVREGRLILLDHEVIHWGDPAFDLGFSLAHLLSKATHLPPLRGAFGDAAQSYWRMYRQIIGDVPWREALEARAVRHAVACLLARCIGRSPLEYLTPDAAARQANAASALMLGGTPSTIEDLTRQFLLRVAKGSAGKEPVQRCP